MSRAQEESEAGSQRMQRRVGRRLKVGAASGALGGAAVGLIVGTLWSSPRAAAFWMALVGLTTFGIAIGGLLGGYGSLESPAPGSEPSDTEHPLAEAPEHTREDEDGLPRHMS